MKDSDGRFFSDEFWEEFNANPDDSGKWRAIRDRLFVVSNIKPDVNAAFDIGVHLAANYIKSGLSFDKVLRKLVKGHPRFMHDCKLIYNAARSEPGMKKEWFASYEEVMMADIEGLFFDIWVDHAHRSLKNGSSFETVAYNLISDFDDDIIPHLRKVYKALYGKVYYERLDSPEAVDAADFDKILDPYDEEPPPRPKRDWTGVPVSLTSALRALVDEWKQEVKPGTGIDYLLEKIDPRPGVGVSLTSNDPTNEIVRAMTSMLMAMGTAADDKAEEYASQYETIEELLEMEGLEGFLTEIAPTD